MEIQATTGGSIVRTNQKRGNYSKSTSTERNKRSQTKQAVLLERDRQTRALLANWRVK